MSQPTPGRFFQAINAYQQSAALQASLELGVFTAIGEGCVTAESLADRCHDEWFEHIRAKRFQIQFRAWWPTSHLFS